MSIPILANHHPADVVGVAELVGNGLVLRFKYGISRETLFSIFPTAGVRLTKTRCEGDLVFVEEAEVLSL